MFGRRKNKKLRDLPGISSPTFDINNLTASLSHLKADPKQAVTPAVIPPMLGKMSVLPTISHQWQSAIACLETAAHITVIGYSFPETDAFMTRLLAEGLKKNNGLEDITIVDIQAESEWEHRLARIFAPPLKQTKVKYTESDAKKFLALLARAGMAKGTAEVIMSPGR
jgi:hypothetical protein